MIEEVASIYIYIPRVLLPHASIHNTKNQHGNYNVPDCLLYLNEIGLKHWEIFHNIYSSSEED